MGFETAALSRMEPRRHCHQKKHLQHRQTRRLHHRLPFVPEPGHPSEISRNQFQPQMHQRLLTISQLLSKTWLAESISCAPFPIPSWQR